MVLPPPEDYRTWAPFKSRRLAMKSWRAWGKWSAFEPMPYLGVLLFIGALLVTAFLKGSESMLANTLYEIVDPYIFGDMWLVGLVACFIAAYVTVALWKELMIHYYYVRSTPKRRRKRGLEPDREPLNVVL